jgi:PAS domain S-box-containing protein
MLNPDGTLSGYRGSDIDITERKQAEDALRESEQKYRTIIENMQEGYHEVDLKGKFTFFNESMRKIIGYEREELLGMNNRQYADEENTRKVYQVYNRVYRTGEPVKNFEWQIIRKDGERRDIEVSISLIRDVEGHPTGFRGIVRDTTERKRTEETIKKREAKISSIFRAAPVGIGMVINRVIKEINDSLCAMTGYDEKELLEKDARILYPSDEDYEFVGREKYRQIAQKATGTVETRWRRKDGRIIDIILSSTAVDPNDQSQGVTFTALDITEHKRAEQEIKEAETRYRSIFENAMEGIYRSTPDGKFIHVNPAMASIYGYESPEDMVQSVSDISTQVYENLNDRKFFIETLGKRGYIEKYEYKVRKKNGNIIWVSNNARAVRDNDGNILHYEGLVQDITERKKMEEALRASEEKYRFITERMSDVIWTLDSNLAVQYVSPSVSKALGFTSEERMKQTLFERITPESFKKVQEVLKFETQRDRESDVDPDRAVTLELEYYHKSGSTVWHETVVSSIRDAEGNITGFHGASRDVTERKKMEAERKGLEERLRRAEKMEAIGTLAGGIAHDFNNILSAIMGYTEMAIQGLDENSPLRRYLDQVFKAAERARDLVKQILAFSRQSEEKPRPLRISPIIKEVLKLLRASVPSTIKIRQNIHEDRDTVFADPAQIHQVLMNLCTNAAHAMQGRQGELNVSLVPVNIEPPDNLIIHHDLSPGKHLRLTVSDTGAGIDNEVMDRIFDPFFTTKKPGEGTGLGLSVVYGIVKSYGGAISVQSEVGKGTEFNVYLPLLTEVEAKQEAKDKTPIPGGKERILFVDDEAALVQLAAGTLSGLGYEVVGRTSSLEALELFRTRPDWFDLVITDMTMPNMAGSELAQRFMRLRPDIPVILCTGFSEAMTQEKAKAIGVREFIMKPIVQRQIAEAIRRVLGDKE